MPTHHKQHTELIQIQKSLIIWRQLYSFTQKIAHHFAMLVQSNQHSLWMLYEIKIRYAKLCRL